MGIPPRVARRDDTLNAFDHRYNQYTKQESIDESASAFYGAVPGFYRSNTICPVWVNVCVGVWAMTR